MKVSGGKHQPIVTVTLNPAMDLAGSVEDVVTNRKLRVDAPQIDPGGGGINIARVVRNLGGHAHAVVALCGPVGEQLGRMLDDAGLDTTRLPCMGDTRQSLAVTERSTGEQYRFHLPGPEWSADCVSRALQQLADMVVPDSWLALSGSNPPGMPDDFAYSLAEKVAAAGGNLVVDISGPALRYLVAKRANIATLRLDRVEAETLAGHALPELADTVDFAQGLVGQGVARVVVIAQGEDGNVLASDAGVWFATAVPVTVVSAVGAGDSFVAGLILGRARGGTWPEALGLAAACATATCTMPATRLAQAEDVRRFLAQGEVSKIR